MEGWEWQIGQILGQHMDRRQIIEGVISFLRCSRITLLRRYVTIGSLIVDGHDNHLPLFFLRAP